LKLYRLDEIEEHIHPAEVKTPLKENLRETTRMKPNLCCFKCFYFKSYSQVFFSFGLGEGRCLQREGGTTNAKDGVQKIGSKKENKSFFLFLFPINNRHTRT